jgi:arylsulfatase A-like enzyme
MLAALIAAALAVPQAGSRGTLSARSALVIVIDDVSSYDLALYGGPVETPNLAALAARGVRFDAALANPTCSVTRRCILFGHWWLTGSGPPCAPPDGRSPTLDDWCLPRLVSQMPILAGKWHLGGAPSGGDDLTAPLEHGFFHWIAGVRANLKGCGSVGYSEWRKIGDGVESDSHQYQPEVLRDRVLFWWDAVGMGKMFIVNLSLAHGPFHVPPAALLPEGYPPPISPRAKYEAMLRAADTIVGQMVAATDPETTLVIVIGDNGTPINISPDPARSKTTTFERGIRVPLIVAGPYVASPGRTSSELVHAVDVWRTVIDWLGGSLPADPAYPIVSTSLLPSLLEESSHSYHDYVLCGNLWGNPGGDRCARSAGFKLRQLDDDGDDVPDREEFYDLTLDPGETVDLIGEPSLAGVVEAHRAWLVASVP